MLHAIKKIKKFDFWMIYFLLLLYSGFGDIPSALTVVVSVGLLLIFSHGSVLVHRRTMKLLMFMMINVTVTECSMAFVYQEGASSLLKILVMTLITLMLAFLFSDNIRLEQFQESYVSCMLVIAVFSIVVNLLFKAIPSIFYSFPTLVNTSGRTGYFALFAIVSDYSMVGAQRNQGIFWEPGAFQMFLELAYLFELSLQKQKPRKWGLAVLLAAIITTMSTTGIIVGAMLFIFTISRYRGKVNAVRAVFIVICAVLAISFILPKLTGYWKYTLVQKISAVLQYRPIISGQITSESVRMDSIAYPLMEFLNSPILGIGTSGYDSLAGIVGHSMFTCTPVNWFVKYGVAYGIIVYYGLWRFFRHCFNTVLDTLIAFFIFLVSVSTEAFQSNIVVLIMCFLGYMLTYQNRRVMIRYENIND